MPNKIEKSTGTYIINSQEQTFSIYSMIEIDRIEDSYYWRRVDNTLAHLVNGDFWDRLENLDEIESEDEIQPGFYFETRSDVCPHAVEIIKFKSSYYYREIGGHLLVKLDLPENKLPADFKRVETDTLDVRAIIIDDTMLNKILNS